MNHELREAAGAHASARVPREPDVPSGLAAIPQRVASASSRRSVRLALAVLIIALDWAVPTQHLPAVPRALIDEPCHFATAVIVLGALTSWRGSPPSRWFISAMLAASVLIDVDHLPGYFGNLALTDGTPRPYTHALWLPAALALVAVAASRRAARSPGAARTLSQATAGAALGVCAHFLRDLVTAPIALLWPASSAGLQMPYGWYLAALLVLAVLPLPARPGRAGSGPDGVSGSR